MGLFDSFGDVASGVGNFISKNAGTLGTLALGAGAVYTTLRGQKARERQLDEYNRYQSQQAANSGGGGSFSGGGGGGMSKKKAAEVSGIYKEYYKQALDMLKPYREAGERVLPQQEASYTKGTAGLSELAKALLNKESIGQAMIPAQNPELKIPEYLRGGSTNAR